jgi:hypothetical protein
MGLHEIKKLLHNRRNGHQIEKAAHRMEKIFASYTSVKVLNIQNIKGSQKTKLSKKSMTQGRNEKMN